MGQLYVPDETFLVCSSGMHVQKMKVSSQQTIKIDGLKLGATIDDRTGGNFVCAKMVIAGAIAGAIIGAAIVATGGLALGALGAAMAIGAAAGAGVGLAASFVMPCLCAIFTMPNDWAPVHPKVTFASKKPLVESSKLPCVLGGVVSIYYSEEAADAQAAYNRANTIYTVGSIVAVSYLAGLFVASTLTAIGTVATTYVAYGGVAAGIEALGGGAVFGAAYGINKGYEFLKRNIDVNGHSIDSYVTGEKYEEEFKDPANSNKEAIEGDNKSLDNVTSSGFDATGRGLDAVKDIGKEQTSNVILSNESSTTTSYNKVFLASSNGDIMAPGNTQVLGSERSSTNSNPVEKPIYNSNGGEVTNTTVIASEETPNLINTTVTDRVTTSTSQFNASVAESMKAGFKGYGNTMFNFKEADFYKSGFGLVLLVDAARAAGSWMLANQIEGIKEAAPAEAEAKSKLSVVEDEI